MELAKAGVTVNAIVPSALTRMVATVPPLAPYVKTAERGEALPEKVRAELGLGTAADVAPLFVWLASDRSAGVTGQCIGIGGDRLSLWSHPAEAAFDLAPGGWTAEEIDADWRECVGASPETVGVTFDL